MNEKKLNKIAVIQYLQNKDLVLKELKEELYKQPLESIGPPNNEPLSSQTILSKISKLTDNLAKKSLEAYKEALKELIQLFVYTEKHNVSIKEIYSIETEIRKIIFLLTRISINKDNQNQCNNQIQIHQAQIHKLLDSLSQNDFINSLSLAEKGHADSQYIIGNKYKFDGDFKAAESWYQKAAEQNHPKAQNNLGLFYLHGQGIGKDINEATRLFWLAARQGLLEAQFNLASIYLNKAEDTGITKNENRKFEMYAEGVKWYIAALLQGDVNSKEILEDLYNENPEFKLQEVAARELISSYIDGKPSAQDALHNLYHQYPELNLQSLVVNVISKLQIKTAEKISRAQSELDFLFKDKEKINHLISENKSEFKQKIHGSNLSQKNLSGVVSLNFHIENRKKHKENKNTALIQKNSESPTLKPPKT